MMRLLNIKPEIIKSIKRGKRTYTPWYKDNKLQGYSSPSLKEEEHTDIFDKNFNHTGSYYNNFLG